MFTSLQTSFKPILVKEVSTLSYSIKSKQLFISSEGFSAREKNVIICSLVQVWQPAADCNDSLAHFFLNLSLLGQVWQPTADNMYVLFGPLQIFKKVYHLANATVSPCSRLSHPTRSPSRIVCRGLEHPKCSKHTVRPDFQANTRPRIFFFM